MQKSSQLVLQVGGIALIAAVVGTGADAAAWWHFKGFVSLLNKNKKQFGAPDESQRIRGVCVFKMLKFGVLICDMEPVGAIFDLLSVKQNPKDLFGNESAS